MRPVSLVPSAQPRLAELPPETTDNGVPTAASTSAASSDSSCILAWSGTTPLWHARLAPDAGQGQAGHAADGAGERHQVVRKHPLPEVAELHHQHDSVCRTLAGGGPGEGLEHR